MRVLARGITRAARLQPGPGDLAAAIAAAGAAWLTFGLLDVLDLSSKGGYILWVYIALLALLVQAQEVAVSSRGWRGFGQIARGPRLALAGVVGAALLGLSVGQSIEWPLPGGRVTRLKVTAITAQPGGTGAH